MSSLIITWDWHRIYPAFTWTEVLMSFWKTLELCDTFRVCWRKEEEDLPCFCGGSALLKHWLLPGESYDPSWWRWRLLSYCVLPFLPRWLSKSSSLLIWLVYFCLYVSLSFSLWNSFEKKQTLSVLSPWINPVQSLAEQLVFFPLCFLVGTMTKIPGLLLPALVRSLAHALGRLFSAWHGFVSVRVCLLLPRSNMWLLFH